MKTLVMVFAGALLFCAACGKNPASPDQSGSRTSAKSAAQDYTKPYLTDDKMTKFIDSMKEQKNPFEVVFKQGGQMQNPLGMAEKLDEFNAFARKYGFQDYEDYTAVWGRIMAGEMQIWAQDMQKGVADSMQKSIASAEAELKKPNLSPDMRKMYEEQIESSKKALADMEKQKTDAVNQADLALVKKYQKQIDEAAKKYKSAG